MAEKRSGLFEAGEAGLGRKARRAAAGVSEVLGEIDLPAGAFTLTPLQKECS